MVDILPRLLNALPEGEPLLMDAVVELPQDDKLAVGLGLLHRLTLVLHIALQHVGQHAVLVILLGERLDLVPELLSKALVLLNELIRHQHLLPHISGVRELVRGRQRVWEHIEG